MRKPKTVQDLFRSVLELMNRRFGMVFESRDSDPDDPPNGHSVVWLSTGEGAGDAGDLMVKITVAGVTKTTTLIDYSIL